METETETRVEAEDHVEVETAVEAASAASVEAARAALLNERGGAVVESAEGLPANAGVDPDESDALVAITLRHAGLGSNPARGRRARRGRRQKKASK
jgi:hypothetical protein